MATAVKRLLSYSVSGMPINISVTGSTITSSVAGNLIHTAGSSTASGSYDEIWIWAQNNHSASDMPLNVQFGSSASLNSSIITTIPFQAGLVPIIPGFILQAGFTVSAFCISASQVAVSGFVNTITD